jgi:hypothetical protein
MELERTVNEPHTVPGKFRRPTYEELLSTKASIDERARKEWREKHGEIHEEYVTIKTQVYLDDVSRFPVSVVLQCTDAISQAGDVTIVLPRYHPPGVASSSMYSGLHPPTSMTKPGLPPIDHFHCNLALSIRTEAMRRAIDVERDFNTQLWWLFHNAVAKGSDPERKKMGHTPASLYGCPKKVFYAARDVFRDRVKAMWDPQHFKYGLWGFDEVEVDIVRGIIFVRYITGWWERDRNQLAEKRLAEQKEKGDASTVQAQRPNIDTIHDDLDA